MSDVTRSPGSALARATGAEGGLEREHNSLSESYPNCLDLQRRHLMRRCGVGSRRASVIAALCFGEGQR